MTTRAVCRLLFVLLSSLGGEAVAASRLVESELDTELVPAPARYSVLLPPGYDDASERLPVLLWLHGGGGDEGFLKSLVPLFETAWRETSAPRMIVVTPDADRSFYLDYRDGSERWETFILDQLLPRIEANYRVDPTRRFVGGVSMGGMGSLRMAFKRPTIFRAVVAFEPGIEPALAWQDVLPEDRFWRDETLMRARYGTREGGIDAAFWADNNPATIADRDPQRLVAAGLAIYLEVGSEDVFGLHRGTDFLHGVLYRRGVPHEYRYVLGADHVGRSLAPRLRDGLAFLARILEPRAADPQVERTRRLVEAMKRRAGIPLAP